MPDAPNRLIPVLSAANFVIGMGAFMVVGLLNPLADDFGITPAIAGWVMIAYAMSYAVASPVLVALTGAVGRRRIIAAGFAIFALANLIAALAPSFELMLAARMLAAAGAGLVTPVAASVAAGLSPPDGQTRVLAAVFFGFTLSQVLGVPVGGYVAYTFGWRTAFALVFVLCLPIIVLIWRQVPAGLAFQPVSLGALGRVLISPRHMLALSFTVVFVAATYVIYTYLSPLLAQTMGFGRDGITGLLLLFGLGGVIGNLVGGRVADRIGPARMLGLLCCVQALVLPWYSALPLPLGVLCALSFLWAAFGWSFTAPQQVRLIAVDPANAQVMLALNAASIYIGAAIGSWIGATALKSAGLLALGVTGAAVMVLALVLLIATERRAGRFAT